MWKMCLLDHVSHLSVLSSIIQNISIFPHMSVTRFGNLGTWERRKNGNTLVTALLFRRCVAWAIAAPVIACCSAAMLHTLGPPSPYGGGHLNPAKRGPLHGDEKKAS